eukprot:GHVQ01014162.1.p1 GENE.GHVQ01014162.1~~GHVQ01014162.1.p1  ORF type:complete len:871 (+),score=136.63 GHVQ01014162.1:736-3348(+)
MDLSKALWFIGQDRVEDVVMIVRMARNSVVGRIQKSLCFMYRLLLFVFVTWWSLMLLSVFDYLLNSFVWGWMIRPIIIWFYCTKKTVKKALCAFMNCRTFLSSLLHYRITTINMASTTTTNTSTTNRGTRSVCPTATGGSTGKDKTDCIPTAMGGSFHPLSSGDSSRGHCEDDVCHYDQERKSSSLSWIESRLAASDGSRIKPLTNLDAVWMQEESTNPCYIIGLCSLKGFVSAEFLTTRLDTQFLPLHDKFRSTLHWVAGKWCWIKANHIDASKHVYVFDQTLPHHQKTYPSTGAVSGLLKVPVPTGASSTSSCSCCLSSCSTCSSSPFCSSDSSLEPILSQIASSCLPYDKPLWRLYVVYERRSPEVPTTPSCSTAPSSPSRPSMSSALAPCTTPSDLSPVMNPSVPSYLPTRCSNIHSETQLSVPINRRDHRLYLSPPPPPLMVGGYNEMEEDDTVYTTHIIFQVHHCVGDGTSISYAFLKHFCDSNTSDTKVKTKDTVCREGVGEGEQDRRRRGDGDDGGQRGCSSVNKRQHKPSLSSRILGAYPSRVAEYAWFAVRKAVSNGIMGTLEPMIANMKKRMLLLYITVVAYMTLVPSTIRTLCLPCLKSTFGLFYRKSSLRPMLSGSKRVAMPVTISLDWLQSVRVKLRKLNHSNGLCADRNTGRFSRLIAVLNKSEKASSLHVTINDLFVYAILGGYRRSMIPHDRHRCSKSLAKAEHGRADKHDSQAMNSYTVQTDLRLLMPVSVRTEIPSEISNMLAHVLVTLPASDVLFSVVKEVNREQKSKTSTILNHCSSHSRGTTTRSVTSSSSRSKRGGTGSSCGPGTSRWRTRQSQLGRDESGSSMKWKAGLSELNEKSLLCRLKVYYV